MTGKELGYISEAHAKGHLSGDGAFTRSCNAWLEQRTGCRKALLTHSCTAALEMAAILADIRPGDEVIMPSYTFVSTANAFVLRGGVPVFVDIRPDTLNIDETRIAGAITPRTRAIVPVHYSGVACEMDPIMALAAERNLLVIEDAAQGMMASYKGRALGSIGHLGAVSFHETKNVISGEGGALLVNDERFALRAEIIAAFLWAQMEEAERITQRRLDLWARYHDLLAELEASGHVRRPVIPPQCLHNAHMYYLLLPDLAKRTAFIAELARQRIQAVFHHVPLHAAPMG